MIRSSEITLKMLFTDYGYLFTVPNYQRSYVWQKKDVVRFLDDCKYCFQTKLDNIQYEHYFGQIILREKEKDRANRSLMEIVDGQQRLTTFSILVSVLYKKIYLLQGTNKKFKEESKKIWDEYLHSCPNEGSVARKLRLSNNDNEILFKVISPDAIVVESPKKTALTSTKNIYNSYDTIEYYINEQLLEKSINEQVSWIKNFLSAIVEKFKIILLTPSDTGYCYALYQIVNDRGISLTAAELLKARTMELLSGNQQLFDKCEKIWDDILLDSGEETKQFLQWHYSSIMFKTVSEKDIQTEYEKNIFNCFGKRALLDIEKSILSEQIEKLYINVVRCRLLKTGKLPVDSKCHKQIELLFQQLIIRLKNTASIPVLLNAFSLPTEKKKQFVIENIIFMFSKFFYIAKTVSKIHPTSISNVYNDISKIISKKSFNLDECREKLQVVLTDKGCSATFNSWIEGDVYNRSSTTATLFLLYMLDILYLSTDYSLKDIKKCGDSAVRVEIQEISTEHILGYSAICTSGELERTKNKLGNLTLIGREKNSDLDSKEYLEKKPFYATSPFSMTRAAANYDQWTLTEFKERHSKLVKKAKELFAL